MRAVVLPPAPAGSPEARLEWCVRAIQDIARASQQDDPNRAADDFTLTSISANLSLNGNATVTTVGQAQTAINNVACVLGTFLDHLKKRGAKRTQ